MASCNGGGCFGGGGHGAKGVDTEWGPNCCPPFKQQYMCKRKPRPQCPVHGRVTRKIRMIPPFPGYPRLPGNNICPVHGPKPYPYPGGMGMYDQPPMGRFPMGRFPMGQPRMGQPRMGQPGNRMPPNMAQQTKPDDAKKINEVSPFDRIPHTPVDIRGIPICNNMAFFDHPLACGIEMKRDCGGGCNLFYVNPKNFKISGNDNYSNNKGLGGAEIDMFFVTEDSETEDDFRNIRDLQMSDRKMYKDTMKIDKKCDTSSLLDRIDQGGDSIYIETKQKLTNNQFVSDERNVQFAPQNSTKFKHFNTIEDHDLLRSWIHSLRSLEEPEFYKLSNDGEHVGNEESLKRKFPSLNYSIASKKEPNITKKIGTCCPYNNRKIQKLGIPNELTGFSDGMKTESDNPIALKEKEKLIIKNNSNTLLDIDSKKIQSKLSKGPIYKNWFNSKLDNDLSTEISKKSAKTKQKKPKKGCENFIRRNILRVKSYQKHFGVQSQSYLDHSSVPTISKIKVKKSPVKSCPDTLTTNAVEVLENVSKWCCDLPNEVHSLGCSSSHRSEPTKSFFGEALKSSQTAVRENDSPKSEKALIVNSKTGSVKSISFEIDESERNKVFIKEDGDLRLPIISLKTKTGASSKVNSEVSCRTKSATANDDQMIQKDIFQIKGFLYETTGDNRETLYISYSNLKKLVRSYSKSLHLKKRDNSNDDLALLLRDSVEIS